MNYTFRKKPIVIEAFQMTVERRQNNVDWLLDRLAEEVDELAQEVMGRSKLCGRRIKAEAVDVANFAMFIASMEASDDD